MIHFNTFEQDPRYLFITYDEPGEDKMLKALENHFNKVPPFCYMPQFKGVPYKEEFLFKRLNKAGKVVYYCAIGLWQEAWFFFRDKLKCKVDFSGIQFSTVHREKPTFEEFKKIVDSWGLKYPPRPYQYEAAWNVIGWRSSLSELCTRSGKTLTAFIIFRYMFEYQGVKKILMIVPSISLVKQGAEDFKEYADFFKTEQIWAGGEEVEYSNVTIGTFQSLIKKLDRTSPKHNPAWFNQFDMVFVDEVHRATASQIKTIISQPFFYKCKLVYGMTGTLPKPNTIERLTVAAELGPKIQTITAKELQDGGYISNIMIHQVKLQYPKGEDLTNLYIKAGEYLVSDYCGENQEKLKKGTKKALPEGHFLYKHYKRLPPGVELTRDQLFSQKFGTGKSPRESYSDYLMSLIKESDSTNYLLLERMVIHDLPFRVSYLKQLIGDHLFKMDGEEDRGNWLILTHHTEYTDYVHEEIAKAFPSKNVYKITGSVSAKKRTDIVKAMKEGNSILVASYGCMSTGMTLPDLRYGVLFESFKSDVVNTQSLGRGLGKSADKDVYEVWDIVDVLPTRKIAGQGKEREKIFKERQYPYDIIKVKAAI